MSKSKLPTHTKDGKFIIRTVLNENGTGLMKYTATPSVEWCGELFIRACQADMAAINTIKQYRTSMSAFIEYIGPNVEMKDVTIKVIKGYKEFMIRKGMNTNWIRYQLSVIRRMIRRLVDLGELPPEMREVAEKITIPKKEDDRRMKVLHPDEIKTFLNSLDFRGQVQAWLLLMTGLRKSDVLRLRWDEVDFHGRRIICRVKGKRKLVLPLTDETISVLSQWRDNLPPRAKDSEWVFPSFDARQPQQEVSKIKNALKALDKDYVLHTLRHTYATYFLQATGDLLSLKEMLGHSDIKTTARYLHVLDTQKRAMQETYSNALGHMYLNGEMPASVQVPTSPLVNLNMAFEPNIIEE